MESTRSQRYKGGTKFTSISSIIFLAAIVVGFAFLQHQTSVRALSREVKHLAFFFFAAVVVVELHAIPRQEQTKPIIGSTFMNSR